MNSTSSPSLDAQVRDPGLDGPVQVPDGGEVLAARDDLADLHAPARPRGAAFANAGHPGSVLQVHGPSGRSRNMKWRSASSLNGTSARCTPGRVVAGGLREVRPGTGAGAAPVAVSRFCTSARVQHLLRTDVEDVLTPALDHLCFGGGEALVGGLLQA